MAGRLTSRQRRAALLLAAITCLVIASHLLLGLELQSLRSSWSSEASAPMPERLQASFVREMKQSAPAVARPPAARAEPRQDQAAPPREVPAQAPADAASEPAPTWAPEAPAAEHAAPPEPVAQAALAASEASASPAAAAPEPAVAAASTVASDKPGPEWPDSVQLRYRLHGNYRGEVQGQGQVQWIREGRRYQVNLDVTLGPSFAPLIARRMSSGGVLTSRGIAPRRYDEDTRVLFSSRRRVSLLFTPRAEGGTEVQLADGSMRLGADGMQDAASQFVHLTWLFLTGREPLQAGRIVEMPLALPRKLYAWRYQVVGEETLDTPIGRLDTWHLRPLLEAGDKLGRDLKAEVWLAPTLQFLPVRLRIAQDENTFVDLMLDAAPLMQAP
ncbi:MAG: hypothetical protein C0423_21495 [Methylibium sp.]|nr:hypothetical protein [Methylibium sp.]